MLLDPLDTVALTTCDDAVLLQAQASLVVERRAVDARISAVAAEIARRSSADAGMAGLAQRAGDRTAARFIERTTGIGADEARRLIEVGSRVRDAGDPVGAAVAAGELSVASAAAITSELGRVVGELPIERAREVEAALVAGAGGLAPSDVRREARAARDALDVEGIPDREERLFQRRRLALSRFGDGMTRIDGLLDPESAAVVSSAFDRVLSPRRGGPRFTDPADVARAERLQADPRTTEQLMVDALVQFVRIAVGADQGEVFGSTAPVVMIHVAQSDLESGEGAASIAGQDAPASIATAQRYACGRSQRILFDGGGAVLELGHEQRLFSRAQRWALAARDGGCLHPGCDRPPSWTEAHHTDEWRAHRGRTDLDRGVLLCAHHHRWVHAGRHRIVCRDGTYGLVRHGTDEFTPWPTKNPVRRRSLALTT